jgi:pyridoxamine 5'-phosphate oxidase
MSPDDDPFALFDLWLREAWASESADANAMALATANPSGLPSVRMVLLKGADTRGFVFYTNRNSRKGTELLANPQAALCFHWKSRERQVRAEGCVEIVSDDEADAYFASRPRDSRIGAWASRQSEEMSGRFELEAEVAKTVARFPVGDVPRPPHWGGFRLVPARIEFWEAAAFRLHRRRAFQRDGDGWRLAWLFP